MRVGIESILLYNVDVRHLYLRRWVHQRSRHPTCKIVSSWSSFVRSTHLRPASRAVVAAYLQPFVYTVFVECVLAGHQTNIALGRIVIKTDQTLMENISSSDKQPILGSNIHTLSVQLEETLPSLSYCVRSAALMICKPELSISSREATGGLTWPRSSASSLIT